MGLLDLRCPDREWGSSARRGALDSILRLVLCVLHLSSLMGLPTQPPCKEEEYPAGAECCPKCGPGYHVMQACTELTGTVCVPCPPSTFTAHANGLSQCLPCDFCNPDMGLMTLRACSRTENTKCGCIRNYFCESHDDEGDRCVQCSPNATWLLHGTWSPHGTRSPHSTRSPHGTRSPHATPGRCTRWLQKETERGSDGTETTCSFTGEFYCLVFILLVFALIVTAVMYLKRRKHRSRELPRMAVPLQGETQESTSKFSVPEGQTPLTMEETPLHG